MMFKFIFILWGVLASFSGVYSQNTPKTNLEKGTQIIQSAKEEIGINKFESNFTSFQLSLKRVNSVNGNEISQTRTTSILFPNKILFTASILKPFESNTTSIWNGEKYKSLRENVRPDGQRIVKDITGRKMGVSLQNAIIKDKETLEKFKKVLDVDPINKFKDDFWIEIFPLILMNSFEKQPEFNYVGQAKSGDRLANVVDTTTESGHSLRLLFDSDTSRLLLMIEKYISFDGDYENKYYYSNYEMTDSILIPKKIKIEHKFTPTGKDANLFYGYIDVLDLKINLNFKPNFFDID